jgi:L-alanine-DL-glutamate epimerase-like enolase superfamily enzyme
MLSTDIRLREVRTSTERIGYRTPIKFGGRVVTDAVTFDVEMDVESRNGKRGTGFGSMPLGNAWAWPSKIVGGEETLTAMRELGERMAKGLVAESPDFGHPLELTGRWHALREKLAGEIAAEMQLAEPIPLLAQLVAISPLEAAVHDAFGRVHQANSYNLLGREFIEADLSKFLLPEFAGEYLDRYTRRQPLPKMPLYHLIGALDPLTDADVAQPVGDGLPETLGEWIVFNGLTHMKIKLNGDDLAWDVARVVAIERVAAETQRRRGVDTWNYSCDFNEKCANVEYVLEFLAKVKEQSPKAFERAQYIEQPTHRDLKTHSENRMHKAAEIKPVVIDESLVDLESLMLAREMGYSGVALKACKGHTEALLMGAAAQKFGLFLCVQDLTCPGFSFLHSASLAARIPTIVAIEGNSRQYCPAGNRGWEERYPGMFRITDGSVKTAELNEVGLGFSRGA